MPAESCLSQGEGRLRVDEPHPKPGPAAVLPCSGWCLRGKRVGDFLLAGVLLVLAAPLVLLTAVLVKLTSRGPAFYSQTRIGASGRLYTIYKLRTMVHNCESHSGPQWSTPGDPRITRLGGFLRRNHIDELPQLWNVLRGDMSLVGPRPERPEFVPHLEQVIPDYQDRLLVRPGLTGLAQVQLPPDTDLASVRRKLAYDLYYVRRASLWFDLRILVCTFLYLVRVPIGLMPRMLLVPRCEVVEQAYRDALGRNGTAMQLQPS
jgi:lipopolysaccharide/colanic/teichoic acid biosynthesis glycosyltransferase